MVFKPLFVSVIQSGGFYSAEDADSLPSDSATEKKEGAFCVWTEEEVRSLLDQPVEGCEAVTLADLFCHYYGVQADGNVNPLQVNIFLFSKRKSVHCLLMFIKVLSSCACKVSNLHR